MLLTLSPSKIGTFLNCKKQYYFEYLDPEIAKIKKQLKKKRAEMEMGSFVHDSLTLFFKTPPEQRNWVKMTEILKQVWQGPRGESYGFETLEQERKFYAQALEMLKWFVKNENINPDIFALPVSPPGKSFDDYLVIPFGEDLELGGKIDRVDKLTNGNLEIIDYKTGKEKDDNLQLLIYVFLAEKIFEKRVEKVRYIYLKSGNSPAVAPQITDKQNAKEKILDIANQIQNEKEWAPHVSKLCDYCDYIAFCPAKK
ncbi:MAG: PD-(D/E)XK nuclease family protein [Candidatus Pacebacteria bacterium]|nr:PD-(D/E)XK nuclease family protein [Candidatus Paceibacterota bacterium]